MRNDTLGSYSEYSGGVPNRHVRRALAKKSGQGRLTKWLSWGATALGFGSGLLGGKAAYASLFSKVSLNEPLPKIYVQEQEEELLFLDPQVEGFEKLAAGVNPGVRSILLDPGRDGVEQITETLLRVRKVKAVHIIAHGQPGAMHLGNTWLTAEKLDSYAPMVRQWFRGGARPDVLLFGCNVGEGSEGSKFIRRLSELSGSDVAASTDLTGAPSQGGDWDLEASTGSIEAQFPITEQARDEMPGTLAAFYVDTIYDFHDETPGDGICYGHTATFDGITYAHYGCSLRAAVEETNELYGPDYIGMDYNSIYGDETISLTYGALLINRDSYGPYGDYLPQVEIDGTGYSGYAVAVAGYNARVFNITTDPYAYYDGYVTLRDMYITDGYTADNGAGVNLDNESQYNSVDLTLEGVEIYGNTASTYGGGAFVYSTIDLYYPYVDLAGTTSISYSYFHDNTAYQGAGLGLKYGQVAYIDYSGINYNTGDNTYGYSQGGGIELLGSVAVVTNSDIDNNTAYYGGGVHVTDKYYSGYLSLAYSSVDGNYAGEGGGIYADFGYSAVTTYYSSVSGNYAYFDDGGGIYFAGSELRVIDSYLVGNYASGDGGAIAVFPYFDYYYYLQTSASIEGSLLLYNEAYNVGGAISTTAAPLTLQSSSYSGYNSVATYNYAYLAGGAIYGGYYADITLQEATQVKYNYSIVAGAGVASVYGGTVTVDGYSQVDYNGFKGSGANRQAAGNNWDGKGGGLPYYAYPIRGGGIYNVDGYVLVQGGSEVNGNAAVYGGGIANGDAPGYYSSPYAASLVVDNSRVNYNTAYVGYYDSFSYYGTYYVYTGIDSGLGGGIYNADGTVSLQNYAQVEYNAAGDGGGVVSVEDFYTAAVADVTVDASEVSDNYAIRFKYSTTSYYYDASTFNYTTKLKYYGRGGGVFNYDGQTAFNNNSTVADNFAYTGGGIFNLDDGGYYTATQASVVFDSSTLAGNAAASYYLSDKYSSGYYASYYGGGNDYLSQSLTVKYQGSGGGIANYDGTFVAQNGSQVVANVAQFGGGVYSSHDGYSYSLASVSIDGSVVDGNVARLPYSLTSYYYYNGYSSYGEYTVFQYERGTGGGISSSGGATVDLANYASVSYNYAGDAGGISISSSYLSAIATLDSSYSAINYNNAYGYSINYQVYDGDYGSFYSYGYGYSGRAGGIASSVATVTLDNTTVDGNESVIAGGIDSYGYYDYYYTGNFYGSLTTTSSSISHNDARGIEVYAYYPGLPGYNTYPGYFYVATPGFGGGVYNIYSPVNMTDTTVDYNRTSFAGGGIVNLFADLNASKDANSPSISYNVAHGKYYAIYNGQTYGAELGAGGGLYNLQGYVTLDAANVLGNFAFEKGAGIANVQGVTIAQNGTLISDNGYYASNVDGYSYNLITYYGGGAWNSLGAFVLDGSTASYNVAYVSGGGVYNYIAQNVLTNSSYVTGNTAYYGGGIYNYGGYAYYNLYTFIDASTVNDNYAVVGGGIDNIGIAGYYGDYAAYTVAYVDSAISGNYAYVTGGGIFNDGAAAGAVTLLLGADVSNNTSPDGLGGGLRNSGAAATTIAYGTSIQNNQAYLGGGILNDTSGYLAIKYSGVSYNTAQSATYSTYGMGGGVANVGGGQAYLYYASVDHNYAADRGAGVRSSNGRVNGTGAYIAYNTTPDTGFGGGIASRYSTLTFEHSYISYNAAGDGAGMTTSVDGVYLTNTYVTGNSAANYAGGIRNGSGSLLFAFDSAIDSNTSYVGGGAMNYGSMNLFDSDVSYNTANYSGGGVYQLGTLRVNSSTVLYNTAGAGAYSGDGGGAFVAGGSAEIHGSVIGLNSAFQGGGIAQIGGSLGVWDTTLLENQSSVQGGGFATLDLARGGPAPADALFSASTFDGNVASTDGGGMALIATTGTVNVQNSTLSGNQATGSGGGVFVAGGTLDVLHATIANNTATGAGGGVASGLASGSPVVQRSIVADNVAATNADFDSGANNTAFDVEYTLVGATGTANINETTPGSNLLNVAPQLAPLMLNGGMTETHMPLETSPAVDAINVAGTLVVDQRGALRPQDAFNDGTVYADMGAVEGVGVVATPTPTVTPTPTSTSTPTETPTVTPTPTETILCARADNNITFELLEVSYPTDAGIKFRWRLTNATSSPLDRVDFRFVPGATVGDLVDGQQYSSTRGRQYTADVVGGDHAGVAFIPSAGTPLDPGQWDEFEFIVQKADLTADTVLWNSATAGGSESRMDMRSSLCFTLPAAVLNAEACYRDEAEEWKTEVTWRVDRGSAAQLYKVYRVDQAGASVLVTPDPLQVGPTGLLQFTEHVAPGSATAYRIEPLTRDGQAVGDMVNVDLGACAQSVDQSSGATAALMAMALMASGMVVITRIRRREERE